MRTVLNKIDNVENFLDDIIEETDNWNSHLSTLVLCVMSTDASIGAHRITIEMFYWL